MRQQFAKHEIDFGHGSGIQVVDEQAGDVFESEPSAAFAGALQEPAHAGDGIRERPGVKPSGGLHQITQGGIEQAHGVLGVVPCAPRWMLPELSSLSL